MLLISRKISEKVVMTLPDGQQITVMLVDTSPVNDPLSGRWLGRAKLGIEAPSTVKISRDPS